MRKVKFKRWIPVEYEKVEGYSKPKKGTRQWEDDFTHEGLFHQWGLNAEEYEVGAASFSIGIVELPDGTIEEIHPFNIKFVDNATYQTTEEMKKSMVTATVTH